jgi:tRNA A-37 threonylcarbamoyl transferase component Bud32
MRLGEDLGPFHLESELGSGAMGSVFRAIRRDTGRPVAIKVIAYGLLGNDTAVRRFEREAEILKQLRHPNIVRFIGTGSKKKTPFLIMEYVEGESLDRLLIRRGAFPWDEVVKLGRQLCQALQHAHEKGIIHRDLKPSNLMILKDDTLKLTDFGIAKASDVTALTGANCTVGTAAYMSPEQCRGEKTLSAKSDLYSMGVVFYELLTGHKPFQRDSPIEMFQAHVSDSFERPSRTVMDIPVWLDTLVCQLLEKKPEHRPYDAAMVEKVLEEVEQKVAEQRSAGVDAATARTTDRGQTRAADETDRNAARTLRGAVTKKKFRKKTIPLTQRKWVQAVMLISGLAGLGGLVFALTRPPSPEKLYRAVQAEVEAKDYDAVTDNASKYLRIYGSRDDDMTQQVRAWDRSTRIDRQESQLHNRVYGKFKKEPAGDVEKLAFEAIKQENAGNVEEATRLWNELTAKVEDATESDSAVYGWLAQRKAGDLAALLVRERRLTDALSYEHALVTSGLKPDLGLVGRACLEALRFEKFGDLPAARDRWEAVRDDHLKALDERGWAILAAAHARQMKAMAVSGKEKEREFRQKLLTEQLLAAEAVPPMADPTRRKKTVEICRDIIALYERDPDPQVNAFAQKAKKLLRDRSWS